MTEQPSFAYRNICIVAHPVWWCEGKADCPLPPLFEWDEGEDRDWNGGERICAECARERIARNNGGMWVWNPIKRAWEPDTEAQAAALLFIEENVR